MRRHLLTSLITAFFTLNTAYAMPINTYFQQGITVDNFSAHGIWISDITSPNTLNNYALGANREVQGAYSPDQFTNPAGQTFSHTIHIIGSQFICTVTSSLRLGLTYTLADKPVSSDESKCDTSIYQSFSQKGAVYGFRIMVRD